MWKTYSRKLKKACISGGSAGMEAASIATERGRKVILYEKSTALGGQENWLCYFLGELNLVA